MTELIHLSNAELIERVSDAAEWADQEEAHELGDEAMVVALCRAVDEDFSMREASDLIVEYKKLNRRFG